MLNQVLKCGFILCLILQSCVPSLPQIKEKSDLIIPKNIENSNSENSENITQKNWRDFFHDETLNQLIAIALKNNQELNILQQEVNIADNEVLRSRGNYFPKVGVVAGYEYEKTSANSARGVSDEKSEIADKLGTRQIGFNSSWELDIYGKLRGKAKSFYLNYLATIEGKNFAQTKLITEIASNYYELMALDNQLEIINEYVTNLEKSRDIVELQKKAGRTTALATTRFDAEIRKVESQRLEIKRAQVSVENNLNKLLGRLPQPIARPSQSFSEVNFKKINGNIPSKLLDNRPDIKQASLQLKASKLMVSSVRKEFYPSLSIDANIGYQSFNSKHLLQSPESVFYNVAGNLTAPLLNRSAIKSEYFSANNKQIQAIYNYEKTFINAFSEVANQLFYTKNLEETYNVKFKQVSALTKSVEISNALFNAARIDYLELLLTKRDFLEAKMELMEVKRKQIISYINLYRALGGSTWQ